MTDSGFASTLALSLPCREGMALAGSWNQVPAPSNTTRDRIRGLQLFKIRYPDDHVFVIVLAKVEDAPARIASELRGLVAVGRLPADLK
jgi:hypothetical protein